MLDLHFDLMPLSLNNIDRTGHKTNIRYKTPKAKEFKRNIELLMMKNYKDEVAEFSAQFDPEIHVLNVAYTYFINHEILLTKRKNKNSSRRVSGRSPDVGNMEKYTTDCIFGVLGINDKTIYSISQRKVPSLEQSSFHAKLVIESLYTNRHYKDFLSL